MYADKDFKVKFFENAVTKTELKILEYDFLSNKNKLRYPGRQFAVDLDCCKKLLKEKISKILGDNFEINGGNYFETTVPYRVHCDTGKDRLDKNYYNIVVPIKFWTDGTYDQDYNQLIILDQNWYQEASFFVAGSNASDEYNKCVFDYKDVENLIEGYDEKLVDLCDHLNKKNLESLSIYATVPWVPGSIIIFKRNSLHCSSNFKKAGVLKKLGLSFFTVTTDPDPSFQDN